MCSGFCLSCDGFPNLIFSWYRASPWLQQALGAVITRTSQFCSDFASLCIPGSSRLPNRIPTTQASCCQASCFAEGRNYKQKFEMPLLRHESQQSPASWPGAEHRVLPHVPAQDWENTLPQQLGLRAVKVGSCHLGSPALCRKVPARGLSLWVQGSFGFRLSVQHWAGRGSAAAACAEWGHRASSAW